MAEADAFYSSLGRRIHDLRKARRLTQEQLGALLRPAVTRASIANIEAGNQGVLAHTLVQLARALAVTPEELLPNEAPPVEKPELRGRLQSELLEKVSVPPEASERLLQKLLAEPASSRRKRERSVRKNRRGKVDRTPGSRDRSS
jgi:transcriptional regulator with XRE-family HTH domain